MNSHTRGHVVSVTIHWLALAMARSAGVAPESLDLMILVDDGGRQPPAVMQRARVGRVGDVPDGGRDRHDGRARLCAAELTGRPLRTRSITFFGSCT